MSGDLAPSDFDTYFEAVHGYKPYPWQSRLTSDVLSEGQWPDVIDLPTGTGKTSILDTAVFALALRPDVFPRRIVFVIDRRIVVDQVFERAVRIRDKISDSSDGVLSEIGSRLKMLTDAEQCLGVSALRGGIPIDGEWVRRPEQPFVMVSTVDQFGSCLLFRGYGVSKGMRPVHAGLAGNDCLVILDEVHLSRAFQRTLRDVSSDGGVPLICSVNRESALVRRYSIVEMSATTHDEQATRFTLVPDDLEASPVLKRIASAPKRATLVKVSGTRPPHESVPKKVLELIKKDLREDEKSVGVIVNRVRTARETHAAMLEAGVKALLVNGRMRPIDKQAAYDNIKELVDPDCPAPTEDRTVVVATQSIEVGADFSFDALITEAAPIDSLQQRFGRLDRRGTRAESTGSAARCWILGVASALNPKKPDLVYADASRVTWEELSQLVDDEEIDVGPAADLPKKLSPDARAPRSEAPLLLPTHIDAWSQTQPTPIADPEIAEFLHGKEAKREPEVSIAWRWDRSESALDLVPPRPAEFLSVPISAVKSWLMGAAETQVADIGSLSEDEQVHRGQGKQDSTSEDLAGVVRWNKRASDRREELKRPSQINPGDLIVVDPMRGGLRDGTWDPGYKPRRGDDEESDRAPVTDVGDEAQLRSGEGAHGIIHASRVTLRLDQRLAELLETLRLTVEGSQISEMPSPDHEQDGDVTREQALESWLEELERLPERCLPEWMRRVVSHFTGEGFDIELVDDQDDVDADGRYWVLAGQLVDSRLMDEFEDAMSLTGTKTRLRDHLVGVGCKVADYGRRLGLGDDLVEDLRLAAELHDLGKIDPRFQQQLRGHDSVSMAEIEEPLAKSLPGARKPRGQWPPVRHEISSVALVQSNPEVLERAHDPDLVLHLVGSHHGHSRPFPPIKKDNNPRQLEVSGEFSDERFRLVTNDDSSTQENPSLCLRTDSDLAETPLALEMADRFWRLQKRYGHHGLAWLESILRLADQQRSAEEAR